MSEQSSPFHFHTMKGSLWSVLFSFQSHLLLFPNLLSYIHFSPIYMLFSKLTMPFTKSCPLYSEFFLLLLFILQYSVQRPRAFTNTIPTLLLCDSSDFYFQIPTKYSTWISQTSDSICPKLKICHLPQINPFPIVPTSVNGTTTYLLAKLESQSPYWLILHNFHYVTSC